jgi:hypothetical protein
MRDQLRGIRDQCLELARQTGRDGEDLVEWWAERAAIREIDGGQPRAEAELDALEELRAYVAAPRRGPLRAGSTLASVTTTKRTADGE